jgi:hypothetical protein
MITGDTLVIYQGHCAFNKNILFIFKPFIMKKAFILNVPKITLVSICICFMSLNHSFAQDTKLPQEYTDNIKKADEFYEAKDYKNSALSYTAAFSAGNGVARVVDHYNAACSWALANMADSAFYHLDYIAGKAKYADYDQTIKDADLNSLHEDKRWLPLLELIKKNKE